MAQLKLAACNPKRRMVVLMKFSQFIPGPRAFFACCSAPHSDSAIYCRLVELGERENGAL